MSTKVRQSVVDAAAHPEEITLRTATDWYKNMLEALNSGDREEMAYANESWTALTITLGEKESVPPFWLSWAISELAQTELRLEVEGGGENFSA